MDNAQAYVGKVIDGRYEILGVLGEGGMGLVLRARHQFTGAEVAVKLLHAHLRIHESLAKRFLAEARAPQAIGHASIVPVTDAGITPEGELYLVMELLRGETVASRAKTQPLPFEEIRRIGLETLDVLVAAHAAGFVHRDLKPENLYLSAPRAQLRVLDFGIAKAMHEEQHKTSTGTVMGTLAYMSPEQLRDASKVDARADLWALGVVLYELVAGVQPHAAPSFGEMLIRLLTVPAPPIAEHLSEVPPALDVFFRRALATRIEDRFTSAQEMAYALRSLPSIALRRRSGEGVAPTAVSVGPSVPAQGPIAAAVGTPPAYAQPAHGAAGMAPGIDRGGWTPMPGAVSGHPRALPPGPSAAGISAPMVGPGPAAWQQAPSASADANKRWGLLALVVLVGLSALGGLGVCVLLVVGSEGKGGGSAEEACANACGVLKECGGVVSAECAKECEGSAPLVSCLQALSEEGESNHCDAVAACVLGAVCGGKGPGGLSSCRETAACEADCGLQHPGDDACVCGCIGRMDRDASMELYGNNACALGRCAEACADGVPFQTCLECFALRCAQESQTCQAN